VNRIQHNFLEEMFMVRKLLCVIAILGLGMVVLAMARAQPAKEPPKYPSLQPELQTTTPPDPTAIPDAEAAQKAVQQKETQLLKLLQEINDASRDMEPGNVLQEARALDAFKKLLPLLKERSTWLLNKQEEFFKAMQLYEAALEKTPAAFRRAAEVYARYAAEEEDLVLKEQYLEMSTRSKKLAAVMQERAKAAKGARAEVAQKLRFVEKSVVFLNRLEQFLAIYDPGAGKSAEVDAYLKQLDAYINHFHASIGAFKALSDKIQNGAGTP
jgi:hypothetical protein